MSSRARTILIVAVVAIVVIAAGVIAVVATSGGSDDATSCPATPTLPPSATVEVVGAPIPAGKAPDDPCVGTKVPAISGVDYAGQPVSIEPGADGPMMIVVMAHWCPHCNREVPLLVQWQQSGQVPEGLQVVGISTAVRSDAPNYPPDEWLSDVMGWTWPVIADDEAQTAAAALGTTGYPFMVFVDGEGNLMERVAGEVPIATVQQLAEAAAATAT